MNANTDTDTIASIDALRALYAAPKERSVKKQLAALDPHCRHFIGLSPFLVLATHDGAGALDASPRGGVPGFVKVRDDHTLLIPDAPGNNRLDSLENIVATGRAGLLFLIPGVDESLRINGTAMLSRAPAEVALFADERRTPTLVIRVTVQEAYLHCAKALMRSGLWREGSRIERSRLPTMGQMLNDQTGAQTPVETQEAMLQRYAADL
jgi:PPOX class probable FMN-dependent enzyme